MWTKALSINKWATTLPSGWIYLLDSIKRGFRNNIGCPLNYRVSHSLWEGSRVKGQGSRPSSIIDRRGRLIILVPTLIAILVSDELGRGEDDCWCLELDSFKEFSFQRVMLCPNHSLQKMSEDHVGTLGCSNLSQIMAHSSGRH